MKKQIIIYSAIFIWMICVAPRFVKAAPLTGTSPFSTSFLTTTSSAVPGFEDIHAFRTSSTSTDADSYNVMKYNSSLFGRSSFQNRHEGRNIFFGSEGISDQKNIDTGNQGDKKPSFFSEHNVAYLLVPLAHAGLSTYLYEFRYKDHREKNAMGSFNAYLSVCSVSALTGGIIGYLIWPAGEGFLGNLQKLIGGIIGLAAGGITGIIVTNRFDFPHRFKKSRPLYYSAPLITMTVGTIMF
jgi:hypothetical protein